MSTAPTYILPNPLAVGPYMPSYPPPGAVPYAPGGQAYPAYYPPAPVLSGPPLPYAGPMIRAAGQAATPQNINAVVTQYEDALKTQKLYTNLALGLAAIGGVVAAWKHFSCKGRITSTELEHYRRADERRIAERSGYYSPWQYAR